LKKYELTKTKYDHFGIVLYRIRALRSFGDVKAGALGGFVQSESNLSHDGTCWIYHNAFVYLEGIVKDDARALDECWIWNSATLRQGATAKNKSFLYGDIDVFGNALIQDEACCQGGKIYENCIVRGRAGVSGAWCHGNSELSGFCRAGGSAELDGNFKLRGNGQVFEGLHDSGVIESWSPYFSDVTKHG
jgi:hypothetical protein